MLSWCAVYLLDVIAAPGGADKRERAAPWRSVRQLFFRKKSSRTLPLAVCCLLLAAVPASAPAITTHTDAETALILLHSTPTLPLARFGLTSNLCPSRAPLDSASHRIPWLQYVCPSSPAASPPLPCHVHDADAASPQQAPNQPRPYPGNYMPNGGAPGVPSGPAPGAIPLLPNQGRVIQQGSIRVLCIADVRGKKPIPAAVTARAAAPYRPG